MRPPRGRPRAPRTVPGACPPGTYVLAHWHERVCIATTSLDPVAFLPGAEVAVVASDPGRVAENTFDVERTSGAFELWMPLGGRRADPRTLVHVRVHLPLRASALRDAGSWR